MAQTSIKSNLLQWGSVKVEMGASVAALEDIGSGQNATLKESWTQTEFETDNGGSMDPEISNQEAEFSMDMNEHDLTKIGMIRGGIDVITPVAGSIVNNATQDITANSVALGDFIPITNQNGDGTAVNVDSVTEDPAGTPAVLVDGTDYEVVKDARGVYGIVLLSGGGADVTKLNRIQYDYTPNASVEMTTGGLTTISPRVLRITNTHAASGKTYQLLFYKAYNSGGLEINFQPDSATSPNTWKLTVKAKKDISRTAGDQLYKLTRETRT